MPDFLSCKFKRVEDIEPPNKLFKFEQILIINDEALDRCQWGFRRLHPGS